MVPRPALTKFPGALSLLTPVSAAIRPSVYSPAFLIRLQSTSSQNDGSPTNSSTKMLTWDNYFALRKQRRRINLVSSILSSVVFTLSGGGYLSTLEFSATQTIMGIEAPAVMGLATVGIGALGWLSGPLVGNAVWKGRVKKMGYAEQVDRKEREFYHHLTKNRVDPRMQSVSNPVPDYYGEKIGSIKDYRRWLRDQRAYNKKTQAFI